MREEVKSMLSIEQIQHAVNHIASDYPIKSVRLFGSYAEGNETEDSDIDVMVEFDKQPVSLLKYFGFQQELSDYLGKPVDIVKYPLSEETSKTLLINRVVKIYGD